jgi:hypothetical protein
MAKTLTIATWNVNHRYSADPDATRIDTKKPSRLRILRAAANVTGIGRDCHAG